MKNICDCESNFCAAAKGHMPTKCHKLNTRRIVAFGIIQNLCEDCIDFAQKKYPGEIQEPGTICDNEFIYKAIAEFNSNKPMEDWAANASDLSPKELSSVLIRAQQFKENAIEHEEHIKMVAERFKSDTAFLQRKGR